MNDSEQSSADQRTLVDFLSPLLLATTGLAVAPLLGIFIQGCLEGWTQSPSVHRLGVPDSVSHLWTQWWPLIALGTALSAIIGTTYLIIKWRERTRSTGGN